MGACPYAECDGTGWLLDEERNEARACRCRAERIRMAQARNLSQTLPRRFRDVAFEREPVVSMDPTLIAGLRRYCHRIDKHLDEGKGLFFYGSTGTGKTTLAMLVAKQALMAGRSAAIYTGIDLLNKLGRTFRKDASEDYHDVVAGLAAVDLLLLDDLAAPRPQEWVLEQLYLIVNRRYELERALIVTADVEAPEEIEKHVSPRTASRLFEMCEPLPLFGKDRRKSRESRGL